MPRRDLSDEFDPQLRRQRLALCHAAIRRARPAYDDADTLAARLQEPGLWMMAGLPSSGKSTLSDVMPELGRTVVRVDEIRAEHGWTFEDPRWQHDAYKIAWQRVRGRLGAGVTFESTGLWEPARERCRQIAGEAGMPVRALVVHTEPEECERREHQRRPETPFFVRVLDAWGKLLETLPGEGYTSLHWIDEDDQRRLPELWRERHGARRHE